MQTVVEQTQTGVVTEQEIPIFTEATPEPTSQVPVEASAEITPAKNELVIPEDAVQLSSGVWVTFKRLNRAISTDLTVKTFTQVNLDKKGNLLTDNLSVKDQLGLAKSISDYNSTLISQGVELVGTVNHYKDKLDLPDNWLRMLMRSSIIDARYYDDQDPDDVEFLFLRYYAFASEDDWAVLSQKTLNA